MRSLHIEPVSISLVASLLVILLPARAQQQAEAGKVDKDRHIYLLIGQSNMAGRAPFGEEESGAIERCLLLNAEDQWEPAKNPFNRYSTIRKGLGMQKMNPGYSFAKAMLESDPDITIGLVVNAKGGSSIKEWAKGTEFYNEAVRRARAAEKSGELKGILWHQGESDREDPDYLPKLKAMIANLREDLGHPLLPFVCGQLNGVPLINDQLMALVASVPMTGCASSENLTTMD
ncbi:MAG: sialate O-acetylesterase, partial [Verrucomicrobiales bacterium]